MANILVIDDEKSIRSTLKDILEHEGFTIELASNGPEALELFSKSQFDAVLCDIKMPGMDGIEVLEKLQEIAHDVPVIMISGHGTIDTAVEAIKKGAFDFIEKPPDLNRLLITLRNAMDKSELISERKVLQSKVSNTSFQPIIGQSKGMKDILS